MSATTTSATTMSATTSPPLAAPADLLEALVADETRSTAAAAASNGDLALAAVLIAETYPHQRISDGPRRFAELLVHTTDPHTACHITKAAYRNELATHTVFELARIATNRPGARLTWDEVTNVCVTSPAWLAALEQSVLWDLTLRHRGWGTQRAGDRVMLAPVMAVVSRLDVLTAAIRYPDGVLNAAAVERFVSIAPAHEIEWLYQTSFVGRDSLAKKLISAMGEAARMELAAKPDLSFIHREAAQATLSDELLERLAAGANQPHVQASLDKALSDRRS